MAKNREAWAVAHWANMHINTATIPFYDTLGAHAFRYMCNQTELITICLGGECVKGVLQKKLDDNTSD